MSERTPVLIVGAGLAGLSTAVFLGLHGTPPLVVQLHGIAVIDVNAVGIGDAQV